MQVNGIFDPCYDRPGHIWSPRDLNSGQPGSDSESSAAFVRNKSPKRTSGQPETPNLTYALYGYKAHSESESWFKFPVSKQERSASIKVKSIKRGTVGRWAGSQVLGLGAWGFAGHGLRRGFGGLGCACTWTPNGVATEWATKQAQWRPPSPGHARAPFKGPLLPGNGPTQPGPGPAARVLGRPLATSMGRGPASAAGPGWVASGPSSCCRVLVCRPAPT
jgi:hypothetical protein